MNSHKAFVRQFLGVMSIDALAVIIVGFLLVYSRISVLMAAGVLSTVAALTGVVLIISLRRVWGRTSVDSKTVPDSARSSNKKLKLARVIVIPLAVTVLFIYTVVTGRNLSIAAKASGFAAWFIIVVPYVVIIVRFIRSRSDKSY